MNPGSAACLVLLGLMVMPAAQTKLDERPNFILFIADNVSVSDFGC